MKKVYHYFNLSSWSWSSCRFRLGFKDVPWGNVWWAQMNMMPVSSDQMPDLSDSGDGEGKGKNPFEGGDLE
jgi:hypothetical protein